MVQEIRGPDHTVDGREAHGGHQHTNAGEGSVRRKEARVRWAIPL